MVVRDFMGESVVGLISGAGLMVQGWRFWRRCRLIEDRPTSRIRSVAMGPAEICGTVVPMGRAIPAPFSERDCVYCQWTVEVPHKRGWRIVDKGVDQVIFYLDDGTGRLLVNPEGAEYFGDVNFREVVVAQSGMQTRGIQAWIAQRTSGWRSFLSGFNRYRFTEQAILVGQKVLAEGVVSKTRVLVDGKELEEKIVGRGDATHPFLLSVHSEEGLLGNLKWKAPLFLWGGLALFMLSLHYIVTTGVGMVGR